MTKLRSTAMRALRDVRRLAAKRRGRTVAFGRSVLADFVPDAPSPQNALDIFAGSWASRLPPPYDQLRAGQTGLFEDERVRWAIGELGGVLGKNVLELGPLEAGHTFMLERHGAESIVAVEANRNAYLKCLIAKELLGLRQSRFLCGDFVEHLRTTSDQYDVCVASGVLYHTQNPVELIALIAAHAQQLFAWTHYYDAARVPSRIGRPRIVPCGSSEYEGFRYDLYRYRYGLSLGWRGFCGGPAPFAYWLTKDDLVGALEHFGWTDVKIGCHDPEHPNGPALAFVASRT